MTPGARLAAAIEVLSEIFARNAAADRTLANWGKAHRFAGSKDRAAIAERVYTVLRRRNECAYAMDDASPRALVVGSLAVVDALDGDRIAALLTDGSHAPGALTQTERQRLDERRRSSDPWVTHNYPDWLHPELTASLGTDLSSEVAALNDRAPLDLRVNTLKTDRAAVLNELRASGIDAAPCELAGTGIRIARADAQVARHPAYLQGRVEIQDEASQLAVILAAPRPGDTVIDLAAGAGGKSLAMAASMRNRGRILACDVEPARLRHMEPRLARAGVTIVENAGDPYGVELDAVKADLVFVDAPCSGTGTWRRNPEAKWTLDRERLSSYRAAQVKLLDRAVQLTKPDGRIAYAVCSLLDGEGRDQAQAFVARSAGWRLESERLLTPARDRTDGFYVAILCGAPRS
jgi:16S rRNA (cytosine967-C5)-methyltransferase